MSSDLVFFMIAVRPFFGGISIFPTDTNVCDGIFPFFLNWVLFRDAWSFCIHYKVLDDRFRILYHLSHQLKNGIIIHVIYIPAFQLPYISMECSCLLNMHFESFTSLTSAFRIICFNRCTRWHFWHSTLKFALTKIPPKWKHSLLNGIHFTNDSTTTETCYK